MKRVSRGGEGGKTKVDGGGNQKPEIRNQAADPSRGDAIGVGSWEGVLCESEQPRAIDGRWTGRRWLEVVDGKFEMEHDVAFVFVALPRQIVKCQLLLALFRRCSSVFQR